MGEKTDRKKLIQGFMQQSGMTRQDAEFAADVELGILSTGNVIAIKEEDESEEDK